MTHQQGKLLHPKEKILKFFIENSPRSDGKGITSARKGWKMAKRPENAQKRNLRAWVKEGLIQSARAICGRFFAVMRRDFAGIIVFISKNPNEIAAEKIRKAPQAH